MALFPINPNECFDCNLYEGLADNIWNGLGFIDNVRNDFILPSIGYPLCILISKYFLSLDSILFMKFNLFFGFLFLYLSLKILNFKGVYILFILHLCFWMIDLKEYHSYSIEPTLFLSYTQLFFFIVLYSLRRSKVSMILLAFSLLFNILIRPVLFPILVLVLIIIIGLFLLRKIKTTALQLFNPVFLFFGLYLSCLGFSYYKYSDSRLTTGTYSDIPLYCANNKYISLDRIYYSTLWGDVSKDSLDIVISPIKLKTNWQERSSLIKKEVISFIVNHYSSFWIGYQWRLSKFTSFQDNNTGYVLFRVWIFLLFVSILNYQNNKKYIIVFSSILFYVLFILLTSLFPYAGIRYTLPCNIMLLISILLLIKSLDMKKYITN
jgi:hypothetical protein